jgi:uncharacterized iron-regulated membrane protein
MNWHAVTGLWLTVGLLFISATGLTWSHYAGGRFFALVEALHGRTPQLAATAPAHPPDAPTVGVAAAAAAARRAGLVAPLQITRPTGPTGTYTVAEVSQSWPIHRDSVAVDPYTGRLAGRLDFADYPLAAKLTTLGIFAHSGTLFGLANQLALIAFAAGVLFVLGCGYRMWWLRRPATSRAGAETPARTAWRPLPRPLVTAGIPAAVVVGWALPVFGVSLAAFLIVDQLVGWVRSRRRTVPAPTVS